MNRSNRQRAARLLAQRSELSYAAALELLRNVKDVPDLNDPAALAELLERHGVTASAESAASSKGQGVAPPTQFVLTLVDDIGYTADMVTSEDLWPDMRDALSKDPDATSWSGETDGSTWTLRPAQTAHAPHSA